MTLETLKFALGSAAALAALWFAVVGLGRFLGWVERSEISRQKAEAEQKALARKTAAPPAPLEPESIGPPAHHVAAIAAAVAACGYRVVHIADAGTGSAWAAEGRLLHQTSHRPH
jgi:hypothetical protein